MRERKNERAEKNKKLGAERGKCERNVFCVATVSVSTFSPGD